MLRQQGRDEFRPVAEIRPGKPVHRAPQIHPTTGCRKVKHSEGSGSLEAFRQRYGRAFAFVDENQIGSEGQAKRDCTAVGEDGWRSSSATIDGSLISSNSRAESSI
jgi:hypothetical protein